MGFRPVGFGTVPSGVITTWVELPRDQLDLRRFFPDVPFSAHRWGVFTTSRVLTDSELESYPDQGGRLMIEQLLRELACRELVWIRSDGTVVYDSRVEMEFPSVNVERLHRCIEDNVVLHEDFDVDDIDWPNVIEDYMKSEDVHADG